MPIVVDVIGQFGHECMPVAGNVLGVGYFGGLCRMMGDQLLSVVGNVGQGIHVGHLHSVAARPPIPT